MKTTEELVRIALLPKPITIDINGIAKKCLALIGKLGKNDKDFCIYNHFTNTFDQVSKGTIIQTRYPVLVFKVKERKAKTYCFFTPNNMPYSVEEEIEPSFWQYTFNKRYGEPIEPTYTLCEHDSFNYLNFQQDPIYNQSMTHYLVDNAYAHNLLTYAKLKGICYISKNLHEFKISDPDQIDGNALKLINWIDLDGVFSRDLEHINKNLVEIFGYPTMCPPFHITTINLGMIENKNNNIEDDIALLNLKQALDSEYREFTLGDMIKIKMGYFLFVKYSRLKILDFNNRVEGREIPLKWLSCVYILESFMLGWKKVNNLKASTIYALVQFNQIHYGNKTDLKQVDLKNYTIKVDKDTQASLWDSQSLHSEINPNIDFDLRDINLLDFIEQLDCAIANQKKRKNKHRKKNQKKTYIDELDCLEIYNEAIARFM